MKDKPNRIPCDQKCDANLGNCCMWKVDERLITLANDKDYKMCERLRSEVLKRCQ